MGVRLGGGAGIGVRSGVVVGVGVQGSEVMRRNDVRATLRGSRLGGLKIHHRYTPTKCNFVIER